jgi:neutral ceramidase
VGPAKPAEREVAYLCDDLDTSEWIKAAYAREILALADERQTEPTVETEVQVLRIGEAAIVAVPCELFAEYGLQIKAASPCRPTLVVGYANGIVGYVPTARAFEEGGYETRLCRSSKLAVDAGERMVAAARRMLAAV